jgi:hypothetical protein
MFKSIITMMETSGLVDVSLGRNAEAPKFEGVDTPSYHPSLASRFKPTKLILRLAERAGVNEGDARNHFIHKLPERVIEVRGKSSTSRGVMTKGNKIKLIHTDKSQLMEDEIRELNEFLVGFSIDGAGFSGYRRLFNDGDVEGFDFQWDGRIYAVGDYSYQGMNNKTERR